MYFLLKYTIEISLPSYCCNNIALTATSEVSISTKDGFVKSGSLKTGEQHNANSSCSKQYVYCYSHYYYLFILSESVKSTALVAKLGINSL